MYIPPGTGKGYKLQILVNGVPSAPIEINYAAPEMNSITDVEGNSNPAFAGTAGGTLLTITGTNFGCHPTAGTIDPDGRVPDGLLTPDELLNIYNNDVRTVDDLLFDFDQSYDETIKFPTDLDRQRKERIKVANGISRQEFDAWQRRDKATPAFVGAKQALDLCQGPPNVQLRTKAGTTTESFPCPVVSLSQTSLTCNATAGEGKELDVLLTPAGTSWSIAPAFKGTGVATANTLVGDTTTKSSSFSYKIPQVINIETTVVAGTDCLSIFGHACGPSSAVVRVPIVVGNQSTSTAANNNRRRLVGTTIPSNNGTVVEPVLMTIHGSNFGRSNGGAAVQVKLLCQSPAADFCTGQQELVLDSTSVVRSQDRITIRLSPGLGINLAVQITIAGQQNVINAQGRFSFVEPKITAVYPEYGKTLQYVTMQDRQDGRFFHRRFVEGDINPTNGVLTLEELRGLLSASEALREIVDLTARDADFTFNTLDFDQSGNLTQDEFISINYSPTDACESSSFESLSQWQDRVQHATKAEKDADPKQYERMCNKPRTMIWFGENLGPVNTDKNPDENTDEKLPINLPSRTKFWLGACHTFVVEQTCTSLKRCVWNSGACGVADATHKGAFSIYDATTLVQDSKCGELSKYDLVEQSWFVTCAPLGLGTNHQMYVSISGREAVSKDAPLWNFAPPIITSSTPRPYNANGEDIFIRGNNLGGVSSPVEVNVSDVVCLNAKWEPSFDTDGLPYVQCRTQRDVVGSKSVNMHVAEQLSAPAKAFQNVQNVTTQLSRFHSVCKSGETNMETGEQRIYYGSPGQLCSICPTGAVCQSESYVQPTSIAGKRSCGHLACIPCCQRLIKRRCRVKHVLLGTVCLFPVLTLSTFLLFHCLVVPLSCCSTVFLFHCLVVPFSCCSTVLLFHFSWFPNQRFLERSIGHHRGR